MCLSFSQFSAFSLTLQTNMEHEVHPPNCHEYAKKKRRKTTEIQGHSRPSGGRVIAEGGVAAA